MIVGDPGIFAIESMIAPGRDEPPERTLGCFLIHIRGAAYGVREPDASLLGCSLDAVTQRLARRGQHCMPAFSDIPAPLIAEAILDAEYRDTGRDSYFGLTHAAFSEQLHANHAQWAPDGDAAFDDGSFVLHFDVEDRVRLIAFRNMPDGAEQIAEAWIESDRFYETLSGWRRAFLGQWVLPGNG